jgi:hypothetical protein
MLKQDAHDCLLTIIQQSIINQFVTNSTYLYYIFTQLHSANPEYVMTIQFIAKKYIDSQKKTIRTVKMKKLLLLFICVLNLALLQAQTTKTLNLTAGALSTALTASEIATITNLTLTGTIDARDFKTIRDNMSLLASINLSGVTVVAYTGTHGTASTNSVIYPANTIPEYCFFNPGTGVAKTSVTAFSFPSSVTSISSNAFYGCQSLPSITIPASVISIESSAFMLCSCLINVDANNPNYSSLDGVLFNKNQTILIQSPVSKTGNYTVPSSVTSIEVAAFWYCSGLTAITISSSVTSIGIYAFYYFSGSINVDANNPNYSSLDGVLFNKTRTTLIQSPVSKTGNYSVPSSVTFIGPYAFWYCDKLTSIIIPSSVTSIGVRAFELCVNLSSIYAYGINPVNLSSSDRVFGDVNKTTCTLYVPFGSKPAYQLASQWKDFTNIVEKAANVKPVVAITSPVSPATTLSGTVVTITATASDADGNVAKVDFFDGATKLGEDLIAPFEYAYTGVAGIHTITAVATDNEGGTTTSAPLTLTVNVDTPPIVSITSPASTGATSKVSVSLTINADASDNVSVSQVEFFVGETNSSGVFNITSLGVDNGAPYSVNYTPISTGAKVLTAVATDSKGQTTTSTSVTVTINNNVAPTVAITFPLPPAASSATGVVVPITATASDTDGTITKVEFFDGATKLGEDLIAPYEYAYTGVAGVHTITAVATDNEGGTTTSAALALTVTNDQPIPIIAITAPLTGTSSKVGVPVNITATARDNGSVSKVEFFINGIPISIDVTAPYEATYTPTLGNHTLTAKSTDNILQVTTSANVLISVVANVAPTVTFTAPATRNMGAAIALTATATDGDGTVSQVEFFDGATSLGVDYVAPYQASFPALTSGIQTLKAVATDNDGATSEKSVSVNVIAPAGIAPYEIGKTEDANEIKEKCSVNTFSIPVYSTQTTMAGVIGYDISLKYDDTKVEPTGRITVSNALLFPETATITNYVTNIDATNSLLNISIFFNGTAIATSNFHGVGQLFSAEFTKNPAFISGEAVFSMPIFNESMKISTSSTATKGGKFIAYKDTEFNGSLIYWKGNIPIKYDIAHPLEYLITNISGNINSSVNVQPDLFCNFKYNTEYGHTIDIKRDFVNTTDVHNVIMSNDALIAAYIANKNATLFTPNVFNMIAADVNLDGVVSAGDASQINLRAVNQIGEFSQVWNASLTPSQPSKDWLFVNSATLTLDAYKISGTYPNDDQMGFSKNRVPAVTFDQELPWADWTGCPEIVGDVYTGIMLGDVNGDYVAIANDGKLKNAKISDDLVILDFTKATDYNNVVTVPVSVSTSLSELHAIDLGIFINDENIKNVEIGQNENFSSLNLGYNVDTKKLNIAGFNSNNSIPKSNTFSLIITKKYSDALQASDFDGVQVNLTDNPMGNIVNGSLQVIDQTTSISDFTSNVTVYPNPAKDHIYVNVSEDSKVRIFDINGRLVLDTTVNGGQKLINVQNLTNGFYMLKVYNNTNREQSIHKIIIKN